METLIFLKNIVQYSDTVHNIPCEEAKLFWKVLTDQLAGPNQNG